MACFQTQTEDISINIVINNAGYMVTGLFADTELDKIMSNYECNATSSLRITHHFLNKMLDSGKRGLVAFTSVRAHYSDTAPACQRAHACVCAHGECAHVKKK